MKPAELFSSLTTQSHAKRFASLRIEVLPRLDTENLISPGCSYELSLKSAW